MPRRRSGRRTGAASRRGRDERLEVRLLFLLLLAANLALFAWQQGAFGELPDSGREPARLARQIEPARLRPLTPAQVQALREQAQRTAAEAAAAPFDLSAGAACVEFGDFGDAQRGRLQPRLEALLPAGRMQAQTVELPGWYLVYLPPAKTRAEAERAAARLRDDGLRDVAVIGEASPLRYGIALGAFRSQELAGRHLADLHRRGVKAARVADKPDTQIATRYVLREVDAGTGVALLALGKEFSASRLAPCGAAAEGAPR